MLNHVELNGITRYPEQDLMNIFLSDQVSELSINFNYPSWFDSIGFFRDTVVNPAIVHFVGPTKPWKKHSIEKKWSSLWRAKYKEIFGNSIEDSDQFSKPYPYDTNAT
jgi:lipopolysaccharide biosynthesis glycosyltransferase